MIFYLNQILTLSKRSLNVKKCLRKIFLLRFHFFIVYKVNTIAIIQKRNSVYENLLLIKFVNCNLRDF